MRTFVRAFLQLEHAFRVTVPGWGTFRRLGGLDELLLPKSSVPPSDDMWRELVSKESGVDWFGPLVDVLLSPTFPCGRKER